MGSGYAAIGLYAPKTESNVGGAMRAAGCFGASMIALQGHRYRRLATDTMAAARSIPLVHGDLLELIPFECVPVAIEICKGSKPLPTYPHPPRAFYIFGPEDGSIPPEILARCREVVQVPTRQCMNLAATVNVVLYDRLVKRSREAATIGGVKLRSVVDSTGEQK